MRAVIDTNVLVSASINREGAPGQLVLLIWSGALVPVVNAHILAEYADVLRRSRFGFPRDWVDELLTDIEALALHSPAVAFDMDAFPDAGDAPSISAALAVGCPVVTVNARHFPAECGVDMLSPAQCLARLIG